MNKFLERILDAINPWARSVKLTVWDVLWLNGSDYVWEYRPPQHYDGIPAGSIIEQLEWERKNAPQFRERRRLRVVT